MSAGVLGGFAQGIFKMEKASFREAAAKNVDEVLAPERLRHEFPPLSGFGVTGEGGFHQRRRVELGFHGFHQEFDGLLKAAEAGFFFFDAADEVVEIVAGGFRKGVEESFEAVAAESTGEEWVDRHDFAVSACHHFVLAFERNVISYLYPVLCLDLSRVHWAGRRGTIHDPQLLPHKAFLAPQT